MANPPMIWVDVETTGLNPDWDQLLEIAMIITDSELEPHAAYTAVVHWPELVSMKPVVWSMHRKSGLINEVLYSRDAKLLPEIEEDLCILLTTQGIDGSSPLCGSSIYFDRSFLKFNMPRVYSYLHYRSIDVSSLKELVKRWRPEEQWKKKEAHRALPDIHESLKELAHYRRVFGL